MAVTTRDQLVESLSKLRTLGSARQGNLDALFSGTPTPAATTSTIGSVKKAAAVADLPAQTVTDIATAQTAITAIVSKINAVLVSQRAAGQI